MVNLHEYEEVFAIEVKLVVPPFLVSVFEFKFFLRYDLAQECELSRPSSFLSSINSLICNVSADVIKGRILFLIESIHDPIFACFSVSPLRIIALLASFSLSEIVTCVSDGLDRQLNFVLLTNIILHRLVFAFSYY